MNCIRLSRDLSPLLLFFTLSLTACAPSTVDQFQLEGKNRIEREQLQKDLPGQRVLLESVDFDANVVFQENGVITGTDLAGETDSGRWSITNDAMLCFKWRSWYFGDNKCYSVYQDHTNQYVLFNQNGVRYYTATVQVDTTRETDSGTVNTQQSPSQSYRPPQPSSNSPSPDSDRDVLIRLARNCPECNLSGSDLQGANLIGADLRGADLSGSDLSRANLRRAKLSNANLSGARLVGTNLPGADLTDCNLQDTDLSGSNLTRAIVHGANFKGAVTTGAVLNSLQGKME